MKTTERYACSISSDINNICETVERIISYLRETYEKIDDCTVFEIKVILNELILNAVRHGNKLDSSKLVKITASIDKNRNAIFTIADEGTGFDYKEFLGKKCYFCKCDSLFDLKETGRGIFIVKNLCESIRYNKKGNRVTVVKSLGKA